MLKELKYEIVIGPTGGKFEPVGPSQSFNWKYKLPQSRNGVYWEIVFLLLFQKLQIRANTKLKMAWLKIRIFTANHIF